jgi:hypothetical protein
MALVVVEDSIRKILDLIESRELELLEIGIVDSYLKKIDIDQIAISVVGTEADAYVKELFSRGAVLELDQGVRSRMAETVRLISKLRQSFPSKPVTDGLPLVWDYRILRQPRRRPEADIEQSVLINAIPGITEFQKKVVSAIAPPRFRNFQVLGTQEILARLKERNESGVMISAGTGSGKTFAFYLPALMAISEILRGDQTNWVKTLAVYPRNELLKDQFNAVLEYVYKASTLPGSPRPIRVGAWFGDTPHSREYVDKLKTHTDGSSLIFPFAKCPKCGTGSLIWRSDDRKNGSENLLCASPQCGVKMPDGMIGITRKGLTDKPADILFSSTESINRQLSDSSTQKGFGFSGIERLRMVLLDEIHTYEGLTGAQNAYLMRRIKHVVQSPIVWVGLSATLTNGEDFMGQMVNLPVSRVEVVKPTESELKPFGAEYSMAIRHDPTQGHGVLSLTLQTAILMGRVLDANPQGLQRAVNSLGMFGKRSFIFGDKLDVINRMYWDLMKIEGWDLPGTPSSGSGPQTLAHLRSNTQSKMKATEKEEKSVRNPDGQWWEISEKLGFNLEQDRGLRITRVSSQQPGVDDKSELVVATSTLEVGYSDNNVGAVIQHKAPADPASFIQRKGRAGRSIEMRPWTVVTLSEWGRDKLAWQLYDQFLFPQVANKYLPVNNRFVQRIQAVYSTMDWLGSRLAQVGQKNSVRTDLVGPAGIVSSDTSPSAKQHRLSRQRRTQEIMKNILERGADFDAWRLHLKNALGLSFEEVDQLLVSPPRPLLLGLIPTIHRRLETQWEDEPVDPNDRNVILRNPLLDFAPSSLFADLLSREVNIVLPVPQGQNVARKPIASDEESLTVLRVLREFMPGNVSRHFGSRRQDRHWVDPSSPQIDVSMVYKGAKVCELNLSDGTTLPLFQPTELTLQTAPMQYQDSSSSSAKWTNDFETVGRGVQVDLPPPLNGSAITRLMAFVHSNGAALRARRFTTKSIGSTVSRQGRVGISNTFVVAGEPVALGFEYEVDALELGILKIDETEPTTWELRDRAVEYLETTTDMPDSVNRFDRTKLTLILQAMAASTVLRSGKAPISLVDLPDDAFLTQAEFVLPVVVGDEDNGDDGLPIATDSAKDVRQLLSDPVVLQAMRKALHFLAGQGKGWDVWRQRRLAVTTGACFLGACQVVVPDVDMDDLQLDISADGLSVLISEMSPGGNGQVERIVEAISDAGIAFTHAFRRQADPGETENLGEELSTAVESISTVPAVRDEGSMLLNAWVGGQVAVQSAFSGLHTELERNGVKISPALVTSLTSRFLGPSGMLESVDLAFDLRKKIESISQLSGFDVDFRIGLWLVQEFMGSQLSAQHSKATNGRDLRRTLEMISWPVGRSAAMFDMWPRSGFEPLPYADRRLISQYLGRITQELTFKIDTEESISQALLDDGEVVINLRDSETSELRKKIIDGLANPLESGPMLVYPKVTGVFAISGRNQIRLSLEEGVSWGD